MRIIIDILPAMGHLNPLLKIIQMLQERGHEIIFIDQGLKAEMDRLGFQTITTGFELSPILLNKREFGFKLFFKSLVKRPEKNFHHNMDFNFKRFMEIIRELSPDAVLLDEQNMLKSVYYEICKVPVISIETKPEPCRNPNVPPFTSTYVPSDSFISNFICCMLWLDKKVKNKLRLKLLQYLSGGYDIYTLTNKICLSYGINLKSRTCLNRACGIGIKDIPRLNISATAFDFPGNKCRSTFYVGPLVEPDRDNHYNMPRYDVLNRNLVEFKKEGKGSVIFCSLGSYSIMHMQRLHCFFTKLRDVAIEETDDMFIVSTGEYFNVGSLVPVPNNMYLFDYLPQTDILNTCDIMITHGGMNSITECVLHEKPILVYPVSPDWDQPGNGTRTVYHKIGLRGSILKDSPRTIIKKLEVIKSNYNAFKRNIQAMKMQFEKNNNSSSVIEIIETIINQYKQENDFRANQENKVFIH
jgi:zeaxanthin glucosyltransferase